MDFNLINILYMFFRLAPFIIVSYFTLQSIFNQDLKGVIYLIGLLILIAGIFISFLARDSMILGQISGSRVIALR